MQIPFVKNDTNSVTWTGGPTHQFQRQHIPGYRGHVPGVKAENLFGEPFAKITGKSLGGKVEPGFIIDEKERFKTTSTESFKVYYEDTAKNKFKLNAENILNATKTSQFTSKVVDVEIEPIDRLPVVGYQGYRPVYRNLVKKNKKVLINEEETAPTLDQVLSHTENRIDIDAKVPIVGYTGFVQGQKAQNMFGRSYHHVATESKLKQGLN